MKDSNGNPLKHGDKAILEIKNVGKGEVDIIELAGDTYIDDDHLGMLKVEEIHRRDDLVLTLI